MSDLELKAYDIKAGYVAWCRGEITKQQAEAAFDCFVRALKAEAWDEAIGDARARLPLGTWGEQELRDANPYRDRE